MSRSQVCVDVCPHLSPRLNLPFAALQSFEEWNPELADRAREVYDNIDELELYVILSHCLMILTLTFPSPAFCVKDLTAVMALDSVIRWYDERLTMLIYSLTPCLRRHGD